MSEATAIAEAVWTDAMSLAKRAIKSATSFFGESSKALSLAERHSITSAASRIQAYAERVAWERSEPLRQTIDGLRIENDRLRASVATQAKE